MSWKIYKITNMINNKSYIGATSQALKKRWNDHKKPSSGSSRCLRNDIAASGKRNFKIELLAEVENQDEASNLEKYHINKADTLHPNGYNLNSGGQNKFIDCFETRLRKRESKIGRPSNSKGHKPWNKGEKTGNANHFKKPVVCLNNKKIYDCSAAAAREIGVNTIAITRVCHGDRKTVHGLIFKFVGETL